VTFYSVGFLRYPTHIIYLFQEYNLGLNMFLVPIKLGPFKFSPYLILIVLLVPKFFSALSISLSSIQICLIYV